MDRPGQAGRGGGQPGVRAPRRAAGQWGPGLEALFKALPKHSAKVLLGDIPQLAQAGPSCLSDHLDDAQACSLPVDQARSPYEPTERAAAAAADVPYVDPVPWLCSSICTALVAHYEVYLDRFHITGAYAEYVADDLGQALTPMALAVHLLWPPPGHTVSGLTGLDAAGGGGADPSHVEFAASRDGDPPLVIGQATFSFAGWLSTWDSRTVPDGVYTVRAVATAGSLTVTSAPVTVTVHNP